MSGPVLLEIDYLNVERKEKKNAYYQSIST